MKLFYNKVGSGRPIIILHGFLGTSDNWITVARKLQDEFEVYLLDQRNHGQSPASMEHTMELMAKDLHEFITDHEIKNPILMGHSMGGKTVMTYSAMYPDQFDRLIIVDIAPRKYKAHHQQLFDALNSLDLKNLESRTQAEEKLKPLIPDDGIRMFLLKNLNRTSEGFSWKANFPVLEKSQDQVGKAIVGDHLTDKKVYFIQGENSAYIQSEDRVRIKEMYPNASILSIKKSGHWPHAEQPDAFFSTLKVLLDSN